MREEEQNLALQTKMLAHKLCAVPLENCDQALAGMHMCVLAPACGGTVRAQVPIWTHLWVLMKLFRTQHFGLECTFPQFSPL